ncbi:hypothetical protein FMM05_05210 [Flavobacterium zepuense]|uniref:DUF4199 domain-containing protein n=1 Tax=Flavobacterium zepuense TaxID=2593302 RepID=A0A552V8I4_9FLAO|nr:hypothetical protein [Flavobacterium zepuense]TRW26777.1 hypothetical protein FMM05_05210 [Flavobacterium zepuense]
MKASRIIINGILIFVAMGAFFLLMQVFGLHRNVYLRLVNFVFVIYGINRTLQGNFKDNINGYFTNIASAILTGVLSLVLGVFAFMLYAEAQGGEAYLQEFADTYIFGGSNPSPYQFGVGLFIEGLASSVIVSFALMQYWKDKVEKIDTVDDRAHNPH